MITDAEAMIKILELSVEKNGEKPLTNKWLLNIIKIAMSKKDITNKQIETYYDVLENSQSIY